MINHEHKFIFVRVAKTASTSIITKLPKSFNSCKGWKYDCNHIPIWHLKANLDKDVFDTYFKFAFVRNPFERAVSIVEYVNAFNRDNGFPHLICDFKEFYVKEFTNEQEKSKYSSQYDFIKGCDFVGKLENLQEDFNIVCDKIGIRRQKLPHKNKTNHRHYTEYYDEETREIVAKKYAKDIEYFEYKFGE
tara:strand:+ start:378 stop:947 length:570 start_codon:yes stop_codon:yes gene_type:complete